MGASLLAWALALLVSAQALVPSPRAGRGRAALTVRHFLSPEMSGAIAKLTDAEGYEKIVSETMVKENCDRAEAEDRYNQFLFDPDGYSILKMNEQLQEQGYSSFEEKFVAENGQEAWDRRQADANAAKEAKGTNALIIVGVLFSAFCYAQSSGIV